MDSKKNPAGKLGQKKQNNNNNPRADKNDSVTQSRVQIEDCAGINNNACRIPSLWKNFLLFIHTTTVCPPKWRVTYVVLLFETLLALIAALGSPCVPLFQSTTGASEAQKVITISLSLGHAISEFLPTMAWTAMLILSFLLLIFLIWPWTFAMPIVVTLHFVPLYYFSVLARTFSGFQVRCGSYHVPALSFVSVGSLVFALLLVVSIMAVLFASWLYLRGENEGEG